VGVESLNQQLVQKCCQALNESLKQHEAPHSLELATYIVLMRSHKTLPELISAIFSMGTTPSDLLSAVMRCQWLLLEAKLPELASLLPQKQMQGLKDTLEHFHYIETLVLEMGEQVWECKFAEAQKELADERESRIVATSLQQWHANNKIKLLNYYKGLPVQVLANVVSVTSGVNPMVVVALSSELRRVLAISEQKSALAPDVEDKHFLQMCVHHLSSDRVSFHLNGLAKIERRKQFRLQPLELTKVDVYQSKKVSGKGVVLDISLTHVSMAISPLHETSFKLGEMIDFSFKMEDSMVKGAAWIRFIRHNEEKVILCVELLPDASTQKILQQKTAVLQRKIIQEIKQKFTMLN